MDTILSLLLNVRVNDYQWDTRCRLPSIFLNFIEVVAEVPGVARGKKKKIEKKKKKKFKQKKFDFFDLKHPSATHECPQKFSAHSVQPFWLAIGNIYMYECLVLLYMIYQLRVLTACIKLHVIIVLYLQNKLLIISVYLLGMGWWISNDCTEVIEIIELEK